MTEPEATTLYLTFFSEVSVIIEISREDLCSYTNLISVTFPDF